MPYELLKIEQYNLLSGIQEKPSPYITEPDALLNIRNYTYERPGSLVSRNGYTNFASLAFATYMAHPAGLFQARISQNEQFSQTVNTSFILFDSGNNLYSYTGIAHEILFPSLTSGATITQPLDFLASNQKVFFANGAAFGSYSGSFACFFSVPVQPAFRASISTVGATITNTAGIGPTMIVPSGTFTFKVAYARAHNGEFEVGEYAPEGSASFSEYYLYRAATLVGTGIEWSLLGISPPTGFGVSWAIPYIKFPGQSTYFGGTFPCLINGPNINDNFSIEFGHFASPTEWDNWPQFVTLKPRFIEDYNNMLFIAGFSLQPNILWHSEIAQPENIRAENFFEVRTDNGDQITCLKSFQGVLVAFKNNSIHEVSGYSPETLALKDVTLEYGCVNNEAAVTFGNKLWFVDQKGICEYSGPSTFIVSYPVETTFKSLDKTKARAFFDKDENRVWFCFGNVALVYDLEAEKWTIYDGIYIEAGKAAEFIKWPGQTSAALSFLRAGSSHYRVDRFGQSIFTDEGSAITLIGQSPFMKRLGDSTQEEWRRLYLNISPTGTTLGVTINFKQDYGTSTVLTRSMTFLPTTYQDRIDFGVSAKSFSFEWIIRASTQIRVNGYTVEARYLRSV